MDSIVNFIRVFLNTAFYTVFGLVMFVAAFMAIVKAAPFSVRKEIEEDQNTALAIIIAGVILGIAIIVAAAVHG